MATKFQLPDLKKLRLELGLTKEEFKTLAGVSRATIDKAEDPTKSVMESSMAKILRGLSAKSGKKYTFDDTKQIT